MKNFFDWFKDLIYDSIDYVIMLLIIVSVVFVIGWRLDVLFANDATDIPPKESIISENKPDKGEKDPKEDDSPLIIPVEDPELEPTNPDSNGTDVNPVVEAPLADPVPETPKVDNPTVTTINITIPPGSLPSKIGSILESNGLATNKNDFVKKAQELKLDTKLKSGNYKIPSNSSVEEILNIITK